MKRASASIPHRDASAQGTRWIKALSSPPSVEHPGSTTMRTFNREGHIFIRRTLTAFQLHLEPLRVLCCPSSGTLKGSIQAPTIESPKGLFGRSQKVLCHGSLGSKKTYRGTLFHPYKIF